MKLVKTKTSNINYLSKIVDIHSFKSHPNPEVTRLKIAVVDGFEIIVGIDEKPGMFVYFPTNSQINPNFLSFANLYRDATKNADTTKSGFFNDNGRVTAIKLKGVVSEGFLLPVSVLNSFLESTISNSIDKFENGVEFDSIEHDGKQFWLSRKYVIRTTTGKSGNTSSKAERKALKFDRIVPSQFRFHYDTQLLKKQPWVIERNSLISITSKIHGTSGISAYVICRKPVSLMKKILYFLSGFGWNKFDLDYQYVYSSRSVIKNRDINTNQNGGYYKCDVWKYADDVIRPFLTKGMTMYYEIVGYLPNGGYIQKDYDYGCTPPVDGKYIHEQNFKVRVYRITITDVDGNVHEFSAREVQQYCEYVGLTPVKELYYGYASDLYPQMRATTKFSKIFMERLANDKSFFMEMRSPDCTNNVPHEGIVIKIEDMKPRAYKLKCFAFLNKEQKELDNNVENIEDNA